MSCICDALRNVQGWPWVCLAVSGGRLGYAWVDLVSFGSVCLCLAPAVVGAWAWDEPESLILAQSERWRHA